MSSGERPIGAAKGKQPNAEALCQPPPPLQPHCPILSLSLKCPLNMSKSSRLFGLAKKRFIQCLWTRHVQRSNTGCGAGTLQKYHQCFGWMGATPPPP